MGRCACNLCGIDPSDGEFFVAKKGIFAKNPKVYKSNADIEADIGSGDLQDKMKQPKGIYLTLESRVLFREIFYMVKGT